MKTKARLAKELSAGASRAFRLVVLPFEDRTRLSWHPSPRLVAEILAHLLPLIFLAYLARRPDTRLIRLLLLPTALMSLLHLTYGYAHDSYNERFNFVHGLAGLHFISLALDYAFARDGVLKQGENYAGEQSAPAGIPGHPPRTASDFLPTWLGDALEVLFAMRGRGWEFGKQVKVHAYARPQERPAFLRATFLSFLRWWLILDFNQCLLHAVPIMQNHHGASIYLSFLSPLRRVALSSALCVCSGFIVFATLNSTYDVVTLIAVGVLGQSPLAWPPLGGQPWKADSISKFWSLEWHQLLRRTFMVFGGIPGGWIAGAPGMLVGMFLASGAFHELGISALGRGMDWNVIVFFLAQGLAVALERGWKKSTGKRVCGVPGQMWTAMFLVWSGHLCVESWVRRGIMSGDIIPNQLSVANHLLGPHLSLDWLIG